MIVDKTASMLAVGDVLSNNGATVEQVVPCGHGASVYLRARFDDGYTQVVTVPAETPIRTWAPDRLVRTPGHSTIEGKGTMTERTSIADVDRIAATVTGGLPAGYEIRVQGRNGYYGADLYRNGQMVDSLHLGTKRELYGYLQGMRQAHLIRERTS